MSVYGADQLRKDSVGQFYRDTGLKLDRVEAMQCCITASGKVLEAKSPVIDIRSALDKWNALPAAERAPGAVKVAGRSVVDPRSLEVSPPPGGLILTVFTRGLIRDNRGKLRSMTGSDLWQGTQGETSLQADYQQGRTAQHEAQPSSMWLTEAEWKSLISSNPKKGDNVPLPTGVTARILRWHLNPLRFYGRYTSDSLDPEEMRAGELNLTVDTVTPDAVRLRLDGFARLGSVPPAAVASGKIASLDQWGYEPRVLGFLEYDRNTRAFTRFDVVALGDHFGRLGFGRRAPARIGLQPLGMAFQLNNGDQPADRVAPGRPSNSRSYFDLGK